MQSALVRKDAVMLHDPMRTHSRATLVGVGIAVIGLAGFLVWGLLSPTNAKPGKGILVSAQSGTVYVYAGKQPRLYRTFNVASARLLYAAIQQQGNGGGQQGSGGGKGPAPVQTVDDSSLQGIPTGRLMGIPDGPDMIPTGDGQRAKGDWAVCDHIPRDVNLNNPTAGGKLVTTALAGVQHLTESLPQNQALLARAPDGQDYLIYRTPSTINQDPNSPFRGSDAVRAKIDPNDSAVANAFNLANVRPRPISTALLNAIPQVKPLQMPQIAGAGRTDGFGLGIDVGGVFSVVGGSGHNVYYVVLRDGIERVSEAAATLVRAQVASGNTQIPVKQFAKITPVPKRQEIDVSSFPDQVPTVLNANTKPTVCLAWSADTSDPQLPKVHTQITVGRRLPMPDGAKTVQVATPNAQGEKIDQFWMPPGHAAVVRSAQGPGTFKTGPLYLVTGRGVKYGVPDQRTANIVGMTKPVPAPQSIVGLLPSGVELTLSAAQQTCDTAQGCIQHGSGAGGNSGSNGRGH